ncbi:hypothetical protein COCON_G00059020 [Conger conger]|uniref:Major facilitator superfamily (MFS) profile domain-containing protein n=1 Tax=Conger conger TaxID=82655 RepID=A0A9Q1DR30_CONCO|nr:hypothetical protein COCON_G00059020 [Conger conger]
MDYRRKRKCTFFTIGLIFLLSGIEYAVILPTIWMYLQTLGAAPYFLGLGLSAFSLSGLLCSPLFGFWSDRMRTTKNVILFSNVFEIIGNFMYFLGYSKWLLLASRFVAGIGTGAGSCIFGFLTRSTASEDRATVFAVVMACRQVGLLIGPAFNIFLRLCDFQLGPFVVNKFTSPGLFMSVLWLLLQLVVLFLYWDLPLRGEGDGEGEGEGGEDEEKPLMSPKETPGTYGTICSSQSESSAPTPVNPFKNFSSAREYLREEVVVLLTAQFIVLFNQTALETMVTPVTQQLFGFGELENSVMYCVCGVEVVAGFLLVRWLSLRVPERGLLAAGLLICNLACVWCLVFLARPQGGYSWQLAEFIIGVFLQVLGLPFVAVAQVSLFSKVTAEKTQGFSQGVRRSVGGLGTILGPLWAGGLTDNLYIMLGVMMGLLVLLSVMMFFSYDRLVEQRVVEQADSPEEEEEEEEERES